MFYNSNTLQSMLVDYVVTEMGYFDDYSDAIPHAKKKRGEMVLIPLFYTLPNVSLSIKQSLLQQHLFPRHGWSHYIKG